jgi:hypothetical protein
MPDENYLQNLCALYANILQFYAKFIRGHRDKPHEKRHGRIHVKLQNRDFCGDARAAKKGPGGAPNAGARRYPHGARQHFTYNIMFLPYAFRVFDFIPAVFLISGLKDANAQCLCADNCRPHARGMS